MQLLLPQKGWGVRLQLNQALSFRISYLTMVYLTWGILVRISLGLVVLLRSVLIDLFVIVTGVRIFLNPVFIISCAYSLITAPSCSMLVPFGEYQPPAIFVTFLGGNLMQIFRVCFLRNLESDLLLELEHLLDHEELLWRQKSRSDWMLLGDRNTRYFHQWAVNRKQRNRISTLKLSDDTWCDDNLTLQEEATRYFASLFSKDDTPEEPFPSERSFPTLHDHLLCHLDDLPTDDELLAPGMREVFFQLDLHSWLRCNLSSHVALPGDDIPWRILFASLLWQLWKNQNDLVFNNLSAPTKSLVNKSLALARYYNEPLKQSSSLPILAADISALHS
ncbi:hypothetical protein V6N13_038911 [Hibiscus sabdariffa]